MSRLNSLVPQGLDSGDSRHGWKRGRGGLGPVLGKYILKKCLLFSVIRRLETTGPI